MAIALILLACSVQALELDAPQKVPLNSAFSVLAQFDELESFNIAEVKLNGETIISFYTGQGTIKKIHIEAVNSAKVLNLYNGDEIDSTMLNIMFAGFKGEGENQIEVEEIGKAKKSAVVRAFAVLPTTFRDDYREEFDRLKNETQVYATDIESVKAKLEEVRTIASGKASQQELTQSIDELSGLLAGLETDVSTKAGLDDVQQTFLAMQSKMDEQKGLLGQLQEETENFTSTGFISLGAVASDPRMGIFGAIIAVVIIAAFVAKGRIPIPKMPKIKKKEEESIYIPSKQDEELTAQVLDEAANGDDSSGKWAFKGGGWKPEKTKAHKSSLGDFIKRD